MPSSCPLSFQKPPHSPPESVQSPVFGNLNAVSEKNPPKILVADLNNPDAQMKMRMEMERLSGNQKRLLKETFPRILEDSRRNGLVLFARYFSDHPHYKNIWPQFRILQDSALLASNELANHVSVYMHGLKEIVEVMDDQEKLTFFMAKIARSHVKWNINKYHITNMLDGIDDILIKTFGKNVNPEITDAWHMLYDVIGNLLDIQKKLVMVRRPF